MNNQELFSEALRLKDAGRSNDALEVLADLESRVKDSASLYAVAGGIFWEIQDFENAELSFRKAIDVEPQSVAPSLGLFHCLWDQDRREEALEEAKRYTALTGSDEYMEIVREINEKAAIEEDASSGS